jgi:hypothetical protein
MAGDKHLSSKCPLLPPAMSLVVPIASRVASKHGQKLTGMIDRSKGAS